jgi:hypothetical protein
MLHAALALLLAADPSPGVSPNPDDLVPPAEIRVKARALVRRLGSEDYPTREEAQKQLTDLGRLAYPALHAGASGNPDPEVRHRCAQLLPAAAALDFKAKLDAFLADTDGRYEHDLPAWTAFRATACREYTFLGATVWADRSVEKAAREVFTELLAAPANRRLMMALNGSRVELTEMVVDRKQEFSDRRSPRGTDEAPRRPTLEDMAALLFADSRVGSQYLPRRGSVTFLLSGSGFTAAARGKDARAQVYRAVAIAWLDSRNEPREMSQAMSVAWNLDLNDQACGIAARLLTMPGVHAMYRSRAASNLASYGSKKHIPLLEKAFTSEVVVASVRPPNAPADVPDPVVFDVQLRDVALAVAILLADQKLADFGFTDRYAGVAGYDTQSYSHTRYYFADDAARKTAFAKWSAWRKSNAGE